MYCNILVEGLIEGLKRNGEVYLAESERFASTKDMYWDPINLRANKQILNGALIAWFKELDKQNIGKGLGIYDYEEFGELLANTGKGLSVQDIYPNLELPTPIITAKFSLRNDRLIMNVTIIKEPLV